MSANLCSFVLLKEHAFPPLSLFKFWQKLASYACLKKQDRKCKRVKKVEKVVIKFIQSVYDIDEKLWLLLIRVIKCELPHDSSSATPVIQVVASEGLSLLGGKYVYFKNTI